MLMPRDTVAYVAVDLEPTKRQATQAAAFARRLGARSPLDLVGAVGRAIGPRAGGSAAAFWVPQRDGRGIASGVVVEARDDEAAREAYERIRVLVRHGREEVSGRPAGLDPLDALRRLRSMPEAAAIVDGHWVVFGSRRAVRAATIAANGLALGEIVQFRRAVEPHRGAGPVLVWLDPRAFGSSMAGLLGFGRGQAKALADRFLGVRFTRPVGGSGELRGGGLRLDTAAEDGCPTAPLADAGGGPADARLVAALPLYGYAQRQCDPSALPPLLVRMPRGRAIDLDRSFGWLQLSRLALRDGALSIAGRVDSLPAARREIAFLGRKLDRQPGVRARATPDGERLDVSATGLPPMRLLLRGHRALIFVGPTPAPSSTQIATTADYRRAQQALGNRKLTALWRDPLPGVALIAAGEPPNGSQARGSGARVVILPR